MTPRAEETPLPVNTTQELVAADILEVRDMAEAIARAEQLVAAPRSSAKRLVHPSANGLDIFDSLTRRSTDDTSGPATPATPVAIAATLRYAAHQARPESITRPVTPAVAMRAPLTPLPMRAADPVHALYTQPSPPPVSRMVLSLPTRGEDDAYYSPAGRIRSLADVTLDGYRPEPTMLLRARARRKSFTWLSVAVLLPIAAIAAIAFFGRQDTATASIAGRTTLSTAIVTATPKPPAPVVQATATSVAVATTPAQAPASVSVASLVSTTTTPSGKGSRPSGTGKAVPTFDVKSLPSAKH